MKHKRTLWLLGLAGIVVLILIAGIILKVKQGFAPAPEYAPSTQEGSEGVPRLERRVVLEGLSHVWDVDFLPDGTPLFSERAGTISKIADGQKVVLHNIGNVYVRGEGGLLGMTVDPNFAQNRFVYACYSTSQDVRVSRWRVNQDASKLSGQADIITGMPVNTSVFPGRHSGCRPRFGADGNLWVGTGDTARGTAPQDPRSLGGKILRVDRSGRGVAGNLDGEFDNRIYSYGHRNVQGLAMFAEPRDGLHGYSVEHGPSRDDEINPLRSGNMGWNPVPLYNELVPMTDTQRYPDAITPLWTSGEATIAPSGMTFLTGDAWQSLEGRLAVAVLKNRHVRLIELDGLDKVASEEVLFQDEFGRIRSVVMGPGNELYITTDNGTNDKIISIIPQ